MCEISNSLRPDMYDLIAVLSNLNNIDNLKNRINREFNIESGSLYNNHVV